MNSSLYIAHIVIPGAYALLPEKMNSPAATAMLLAIGLQESRFVYRNQARGPAGGFWQFEDIAVKSVVESSHTKDAIAIVLATMGYQVSIPMIQDALSNNDILACVYARLLLWAHPGPLPLRTDVNPAWAYYLACWRPGRPFSGTWAGFYKQAWDITEGVQP